MMLRPPHMHHPYCRSSLSLRRLAHRWLAWFSPPSSYLSSTPSPLLSISPAVHAALMARLPVVALESTIITHGMPYPTNLETARDVEAIVAAGGATPATIAVLDGRLCVGLTSAQLEALAKDGPERAIKCSRRDLPWVLATKAWGATTVASTLHIAHLAGVRVFVTGGVGGVHRGAEQTMDVSADLLELGRVPGMAVVCAGVKSILDIAKTLEVLETQGVPVVSYQTHAFPAFFTPDSGLRAPARVDSPEDVARMLQASSAASLPSSVLVAVPNPVPAAAAATQAAIEDALKEAEGRGLAGKDVTPFLLQRVNEATAGASLKANIELVKNNAKVGTAIAVALAALEEGEWSWALKGCVGGGEGKGNGVRSRWETSYSSTQSSTTITPSSPTPPPPAPQVLVVGGAVLDLVGSPKPDNSLSRSSSMHVQQRLEFGTSSPGLVRQKEGGVARNVAEGLTRLGVSTALLSAIAQDSAGAALLSSLRTLGPLLHLNGSSSSGDDCMLLHQAPSPAHRTASCLVALDGGGDLVVAVADMDIFREYLTPKRVLAGLDTATAATAAAAATGPSSPTSSPSSSSLALVVCDGNLSVPAFQTLALACASRGLPLLFEPTSASKALLPLQARVLQHISIMTPNLKELDRLAVALEEGGGLGEGGQEGHHGVVEQLEERLVEALRGGSVGGLAEEEVLRLLRPDLKRVLMAMAGEEGGEEGGERELGEGDTAGKRSRADGWKGEKHLLLTLGKHGLVWASIPATSRRKRDVQARYLPIPGGQAVEAMANCTGAGDTLVAGVVAALVRGGEGGMEAALAMGLAAARESVQVNEAVPRHLTWEGLQRAIGEVKRKKK